MDKYSVIFTGEIVEAAQVTDETAAEIRDWCSGRLVIEHDALDDSKTFPAVNVLTPYGRQRASEGFWVVHTADGSFHVISPSIFPKHYEAEYKGE